MATASATITVPMAATVGPSRAQISRPRVTYIKGLNSFCGLKAHNKVVSLGLPVSSEQSFAKIVGSLKGKKGGALTASCSSAINEIFKIAAIMPGLVLVGVAVGFVLLRVEAFVEEE